jgi:hypothetical protein
LQRVKQANDENSRADGPQIFRRKTDPKPFTCACQRQSDQQQGDVAPEREEISDSAPAN